MHRSKFPNNRIEYRYFEEKDIESIMQLLQANKLPVSDLSESEVDFTVATDQGEVVGCIGLEQCGTEGLLRSFAVKVSIKAKV